MGCGQSKKGTATVTPIKKKDSAASTLRSGLVGTIEKTQDISKTYDLGNQRVLGSGATSTVKTIKHRVTGVEYALKSIRLNRMDKNKRAMLIQEVELMKLMDHPYIVKIVSTYMTFQVLHIVMELCTGGELFDLLYDQPECKFTEPDCAKLATKMLGAINYLHSMDICHRDLKLENFIFSEQYPAGEIKMIDFGFSKHYLTKEHMHEVVGTSYYIAPEVLAKDYTQKSDLWSLGVIFFMMLSGRCPFGGSDDYEIQENVRSGKFEMRGKHWQNVSSEARHFIKCLLEMDVEARFNAEQALNHPWIKNIGQCSSTGESPRTPAEEAAGEEAVGTMVSNLKTYREFSRLKKTALVAVAVGMADKDVDMMKTAFEELDLKNNGTISLEEFRQVMLKTKFVADSDIENLFRDVDLDQTGMIKYSEFLAACLQENLYLNEDRVVDAFNKLDVDHSGVISRENIAEVLGNDLDSDAIDRMIAEADFHNDGVINLDEFRRMMNGEKAN